MEARPGTGTAVAWVDTTATGRSLGRGILDTGDHLAGPDPASEAEGLAYRPPRSRRAPGCRSARSPRGPSRGFNSLYFRATPQDDSGLTDLAGFFHRLDAVEAWNRLLGPRGFVQYQFVVPDGAHDLMAGGAGDRAAAPLRLVPRHPEPVRDSPARAICRSPSPAGRWRSTCPRGTRRLGPDAGRTGSTARRRRAAGSNLAKDSRLSPRRPARRPCPQDWRTWREAARARLDPAGVFQSDLGRRIGLC